MPPRLPTSLLAYQPTRLRVLGIDPGFDRTGFGVIDDLSGKVSWVAHGCVQTKTSMTFAERLKMTRDGIVQAINDFQPQGVAIEQLFFQTNVKTALQVGMARGVILLAVADAGLPLVELTPGQVKQGVAGWGNADKKQVQAMVQRLLNLKKIPQPDDAADALAIAMVGSRLFVSRKKN